MMTRQKNATLPAVPSASGPARLEMYSSAYTLSDMEIFVFPQLLYSLMLANIMSERIWRWRDDPWFDNIAELTPEKRVSRLKQYIMDHYTFNLDLETWGLTTKEAELARFGDFIDQETLRESNALFGYEGDKYYFSIDIRRHFGLDKYTTNVIPFWKTETVQAMDAFAGKPGWRTGGGECVSLAALYAAALFVVARIPLENIFLFATPLHSQNFVDIGEGILTNNRRIVTKVMFFNGSEISQKARRALENEKITVVSHASGWIHYLYAQATIDPAVYGRFASRLGGYLRMPFDPEIFGNFIRCHPEFQHCFCYRHVGEGGGELYIECEKALRYEEATKLRVSDRSRKKLLEMIDRDEFYPQPIPGRLVVNDIEDFIRSEKIRFEDSEDCCKLQGKFCGACGETCNILQALREFIHVTPRLPELEGREIVRDETLDFSVDLGREGIVAFLADRRAKSETVDLAFHAARMPGEWLEPFFHAAFGRNPVSIDGAKDLAGLDDVRRTLDAWPDVSIYESDRLAQPDEVWNYMTGDGLEKALALANIALARGAAAVALDKIGGEVSLIVDGVTYRFATAKQFADFSWHRR